MSPRRVDPRVRPALIRVAARLLSAEGPGALTTRRVAREAGCSTMAVYTHFDGMPGLVRAMVHEGFSRLHAHFARVAPSTDPVADLALFGRAYRLNAVSNPHLYAVMFGAASLGGFTLSEEDRQHGRYTMVGVIECVGRCVGSGRFRDADSAMVAHHMWSAVHGLASLELGDYLVEPYRADSCFDTQLCALMTGAGDRPESASRSVTASGATFRSVFGPPGARVPRGEAARSSP